MKSTAIAIIMPGMDMAKGMPKSPKKPGKPGNVKIYLQVSRYANRIS
jgi:hypothetical protein